MFNPAKMFKSHQILVLILGILGSCSGLPREDVSLDNDKMVAYIKSYKELIQKAPVLLTLVNTGDINNQKQEFSELEGILEENGLSYHEFIIINAKIGAIYSIIQAQDFMSKMEDIQSQSQKSIDDGILQIQEAIDDPDVPVETKTELRKNIKELKDSKKLLKNEYHKNEKWANLVLDKTRNITNQIVNKKDVELVERYLDEISEAYTGGVIPENFIIEGFQ